MTHKPTIDDIIIDQLFSGIALTNHSNQDPFIYDLNTSNSNNLKTMSSELMKITPEILNSQNIVTDMEKSELNVGKYGEDLNLKSLFNENSSKSNENEDPLQNSYNTNSNNIQTIEGYYETGNKQFENHIEIPSGKLIKCILYYPNGNIKFLSDTYNIEGKPDDSPLEIQSLKTDEIRYGYYYTEAGYLNMEGWFTKIGLKDGNGIIYNEFQKRVYKGDLLKGLKDGKGIEYDDDGNKKFKGNFVEGKKNGFMLQYDDDGNLIYKGDFVNDERNGKGIEYDEDGNKRYEGSFSNGIREGNGKIYDKNGIIRFSGNFNSGIIQGQGVANDMYGNRIYEGEFLNNKFDGYGLLYHKNIPSNVVYYQGQFIKGKMHGEGKEYDLQGN